MSGDHFAKPGANDRIWGALDKLAVAHPAVFFDYYANDVVALASSAWLGPNYQMTSALNIVNPGGQAQPAHRDYHLGFMPLETAAGYPEHLHRLSPVLTLQGAVAHCDMPVETGPTMYLPHSQKYVPGYLATGLPEFVEYFAQNYVQLPLAKGDAVFFNPALFHGAGTNQSADVRRMANLLQVSSAFGRALESVDRTRAILAHYPTLLTRKASGAPAREIANVIAASAEGYPFPTNLHLDQPIGSLNPETQAELVRRAVDSRWEADRFVAEVTAADLRRRAGRAVRYAGSARFPSTAGQSGADQTRWVPPSVERSMTQLPPEAAARETRLCRPLRATVSGIPMPLSVTSSTRSDPTVMMTPSSVAPAWRTVLLTASRITACACCARAGETMATRPENPMDVCRSVSAVISSTMLVRMPPSRGVSGVTTCKSKTAVRISVMTAFSCSMCSAMRAASAGDFARRWVPCRPRPTPNNCVMT